MTTLKRIVLITSVVFLSLCLGLTFVWKNFLTTPLIKNPEGLRYNVRAGASFKSVSTDLYNLHVLKHPNLFMLLVRYRGVTHTLKAGEYFFPKGATPSRIINQISTGTGMIYHAFTVIPGMTFSQLRQTLNKNNEITHTSISFSDAAIMRWLGHPELKPEGQFFPETYYFLLDSSDMILLKRAFNTMQSRLNSAWANRDIGLPFKNSYEALIAASIIEKEAKAKEELPLIAGVLSNRLKQGMILQFDPTVIYGLGTRYDGTIHKSDLLENNPFNTYVIKGLPPTPISMPGKDAINAVMHPSVNNYLYFVATGDGRTHHFSNTLTEHKMAVATAKQIQNPKVTTVVKPKKIKSHTKSLKKKKRR